MKIKCYLFILTFQSFISDISAQSPNWKWAKGVGGSDAESGFSVESNVNGDVFLTGVFSSPSITFGATTLTNSSPSTHDIFIAKYDSSGNVLWAKSAGGLSDDFGYDIATDAFGNLFLTGYFQSPSITFGTTTLINAGFGDMFIAKYNANGNVLWVKHAGGSSVDGGTSVCTDTIGNIYLTGSFYSPSISFGPTTLTNSGGSNIFIAKYDTNGNIQWAKSAGGNNDDIGFDVQTDKNGNIMMTGNFRSSTINFGTNTLTNNGSSDIFIAKYDAMGNNLWANSYGGISVDDESGVSADLAGNIYMTGYFQSPTISFDSIMLTNSGAGFEDLFIVKFDLNGNTLWAKRAGGGGINDDGAFGICSDENGNALMTGTFECPTITFGATTLTNSNPGDGDAFVVKYDANGNSIWAKSFGGINTVLSFDICTNIRGYIFLTGTFKDSTIYLGTATLTNYGSDDIFIAKLNESTIGINEFSLNSEILIAPNPFVNNTTITFNNEQKNTTINIFDVLGNQIKSIKFTGIEYLFEKKEMLSGIYYIQIINEQQKAIYKKIVIQ